MSLLETITDLIKQGEALAPQGGNGLEGYNGMMQDQYVAWRLQVLSMLHELGSPAKPLIADLNADKKGPYFYNQSAQRVLGALKAAQAIAQRKPAAPVSREPSSGKQPTTKKVFVVHGRNDSFREQTARFLEKLDLEPVILFEQAGQSRTIIEKLEHHSSDVSYAIILLTGDDVGGLVGEPHDKQKPRARQNVILELGLFLGLLGRKNTVALYEKGVELPSDYMGIEYIELDSRGAWKFQIAKELREAGFNIDLNKAL
jgi:predicted nucleotide-binding protein